MRLNSTLFAGRLGGRRVTDAGTCGAGLNVFMVKIRLKRAGAKNTPAYRIVVADSRSPRDGRFIEELGSYVPLRKGTDFTLKLDRAEFWLSRGAQPSETVASFIRQARKQAATVPATV